MARYKIGDIVRVRKDLKHDGAQYYMYDDKKIHDSFVWPMDSYTGKEVEIAAITLSGKYRIKDDDYGYNWVDEMFEDAVVFKVSDDALINFL